MTQQKTHGILKTDGTFVLVKKPNHYTSIQECVGGTFATVHLPHFKGQVYANDDGFALGLPLNPWAQKIGYHAPLVGDLCVVFSSRDVSEADIQKVVPNAAQRKKADEQAARYRAVFG